MTVPFNFLRASKNQCQTASCSLQPMVWDDDVPRKLRSEDGYIMVAMLPRLTGYSGTVRHLTKLIRNPVNIECRQKLPSMSLSM